MGNLIGRLHDDEKIDVAVFVGRAVGVRAEQNDLVGFELFGYGSGVAAYHAHGHVGPGVEALGRKRERPWVFLRHEIIISAASRRGLSPPLFLVQIVDMKQSVLDNALKVA